MKLIQCDSRIECVTQQALEETNVGAVCSQHFHHVSETPGSLAYSQGVIQRQKKKGKRASRAKMAYWKSAASLFAPFPPPPQTLPLPKTLWQWDRQRVYFLPFSRSRIWPSPSRCWTRGPSGTCSMWRRWRCSSGAWKQSSGRWRRTTSRTSPSNTRYLEGFSTTESALIHSNHAQPFSPCWLCVCVGAADVGVSALCLAHVHTACQGGQTVLKEAKKKESHHLPKWIDHVSINGLMQRKCLK